MSQRQDRPDPVGSLEEALESSKATPGVEGRVLGDFRIVREIGRGGMGVVYEACQISLERRVALKVLPADNALAGSAVARFEREATAAGRLQHHGIVEVYTSGSDAGTRYFAMTLVPGAPLDKVLARLLTLPREALGGRSLQDAVAALRVCAPPGDPTAGYRAALWSRGYPEAIAGLIADVAEALHHAHEAGILHRDVKPANILVQSDGTPVLTDFGLARDQSGLALTRTGEMPGTVYYMSPEQASTRKVRIDRRSDVFALGVTLYEALALKRPFEGETSHEVLSRIAAREPIDLQRLNPHVSDDLAAIVLKALEKEPERRYATAAAFAQDLRSYLALEPVAARRASAPRRLLRWARRQPLKAALAAVLFLSVPSIAGLSGYVWASSREREAGRDALKREQIERLLAEGLSAQKQRRWSHALAGYQGVLALDPEDPDAICEMALTLHGQSDGDCSGSLAFLEQHADIVKRRPGLERLQAFLLLKKGRAVEGAGSESALGDPEDPLDYRIAAFTERQTAFVERRTDDNVRRRIAGHWMRAVLLLSAPRLSYHLGLFWAASECKDLEGARQAAEAATVLWPESAQSWTVMGHACRVQDPARSRRAFERAIALQRAELASNPSSGGVHAELGILLLMEAGDIPAAVVEFRHAVDLDPRDFTTRMMLASWLLSDPDPGCQGEGERILREGADLDPRYTVTVTGLLQQKDTIRKGRLGAELRIAVRARPQDAVARNQLACFALDHPGAEPQEAMTNAQAAVELSSRRSAKYEFDLARACRQAGHHERAEQIGRAALQLARDTTNEALASQIEAFLQPPASRPGR